ncbi:MAG: hypothetical protein HUJ65_03615 [Oscillospiraceae bacterium]|nr:hypothetical protein [Oscillospiraceae bacterium]
MASRLQLLMDNFSISGKDLSAILHVDSSLVSKWRNGSRTLKPNSTYTTQIIKHVMTLDKSNQFAKIRLLLSNDYVGIYKCSDSELSIYLKDWLTSNVKPVSSSDEFLDNLQNLKNTTQVLSYSLSGTKGREQATMFFLKYAQHISPGVEIWICSTENTRVLSNDMTYIHEWHSRYMSLLADKNTVKIIHTLTGSYEALATSLLAWLPMHLTGKSTAYFIPKYKDEPIAFTYNLIRGHLALFNWSSPQQTDELNTYLSHEPKVVRDIELMLESRFADSLRVFEKFTYSTREAYINSLVSFLEQESNEYHWCASLTMYALPDDVLREILVRNGITGDELEQNMDTIMLLKELNEKLPHRYIIDLEGMRNMFRQDEIPINELSFICKKTITLDRESMLRTVKAVNESSDHPENVKLCLASTELLARLDSTEVIAKEGGRVIVMRAFCEDPCVLSASEVTVVSALFSYFEELWNTTPYICRNREYVTKQISKTLNEVAKKYNIDI